MTKTARGIAVSKGAGMRVRAMGVCPDVRSAPLVLQRDELFFDKWLMV